MVIAINEIRISNIRLGRPTFTGAVTLKQSWYVRFNSVDGGR